MFSLYAIDNKSNAEKVLKAYEKDFAMLVQFIWKELFKNKVYKQRDTSFSFGRSGKATDIQGIEFNISVAAKKLWYSFVKDSYKT